MNYKLIIIKIEYKLLNFILLTFKKFLFKKTIINDIKKIVILRTGSLGDNICALPAINNIRKNFKTSNITIIYDAGQNNLVNIEQIADNSIADKFINYHGKTKKQLFKIVKEIKPDLFIDLIQTHANLYTQLRNMVFAKIVGAKFAFGWKIIATRTFSQIQAKKIKFNSVKTYFNKILSENNLKIFSDEYKLNIQNSDYLFINKIISDYKIPQNFVTIVPGAKRSQNKWKTDYFIEVAKYLQLKKLGIVIIGGPETSEDAEYINSQVKVINLSGKLSPIQSGLIIEKSKFCISNDTGPMHLSYAFGTFVFAIFGSRDYPQLWFPPENLSTVFRNYNIHCSECFSDTCSYNICMTQIYPEIIIKEIENHLNQIHNEYNP